ncbi:MAG: gamma-glutamyltransferase, partial [Hyphomicrobium sp.]
GSRISLYVIKNLVAMLDWGLDPQAAAAMMNFGSEGGAFLYETDSPDVIQAMNLKTQGHTLSGEMMTSGVHTILRRGGRLEGGADPRREGAALGD